MVSVHACVHVELKRAGIAVQFLLVFKVALDHRQFRAVLLLADTSASERVVSCVRQSDPHIGVMWECTRSRVEASVVVVMSKKDDVVSSEMSSCTCTHAFERQ
jgi:hypothetical protein